MRIALLLTLLALSPIATASAQDYQDGQLWVQTVATGQISKNWRTHLELQPRVFDNGRELGITIIRAAIGRQIAPRVTLWGGYAFVARSLGPQTRWEQRTWQQASLVLPRAGAWSPSARIRLEQRRLDQWADTSHRLRLLARAQRPLGTNTPWHVALSNETMLSFDTTTPGPARGYDRNRAFSGVGRRLSPALTAEAGYMWENSTIKGPGQRNEHIALFVLNAAWPRR